jgi:hypothetical protein
MPEDRFFDLTPAERRHLLRQAAERSGRPGHHLEKDAWVVWALGVLYAERFGPDLIFKGGTSLSKAYDVISRFSEDVDITYNIRAIAPDLVADHEEALPPSRKKERRWTKTIRKRLVAWVAETVAPLLSEKVAEAGLSASVRTQGAKVFLDYDQLVPGTGYTQPVVLLEFYARATGEPFESRKITCDAAAHVSGVLFPEVVTNVMRPERTFWEKATAMHVFCCGGRFHRAERFSRHWYDAVCLDDAGHVETALADRQLAGRVVRHKTMFQRAKDAQGRVIDYHAAVAGELQLVPARLEAEMLANDYHGMVGDGYLYGDAPGFETLVARCEDIQQRANG